MGVVAPYYRLLSGRLLMVGTKNRAYRLSHLALARVMGDAAVEHMESLDPSPTLVACLRNLAPARGLYCCSTVHGRLVILCRESCTLNKMDGMEVDVVRIAMRVGWIDTVDDHLDAEGDMVHKLEQEGVGCSDEVEEHGLEGVGEVDRSCCGESGHQEDMRFHFGGAVGVDLAILERCCKDVEGWQVWVRQETA
jgi:hypothetical protein